MAPLDGPQRVRQGAKSGATLDGPRRSARLRGPKAGAPTPSPVAMRHSSLCRSSRLPIRRPLGFGQNLCDGCWRTESPADRAAPLDDGVRLSATFNGRSGCWGTAMVNRVQWRPLRRAHSADQDRGRRPAMELRIRTTWPAPSTGAGIVRPGLAWRESKLECRHRGFRPVCETASRSRASCTGRPIELRKPEPRWRGGGPRQRGDGA